MGTAKAFASYKEGDEGCAVSVSCYGKGKAYYVSSEANSLVLGWLYDKIALEEELLKGITAPEGVVIRKLSESEYLFVNTTSKTKEIEIQKEAKGVLKGAIVTGRLILSPYDGELLIGEDLLSGI